jgi:glutaredoxin-dependent peroxiredoxin
MSVDVGSQAPDFTLPDQNGHPVSLSSAAGQNVLLAFFPAAFTSVCTKELCHFRDDMARLTRANAVVYGISVDTPFTLKEFASQQRLDFPLLSDFNKDVITRYGVVNPDMQGLKGISLRAVFVIDRHGIVQHKEITANPGVEPDYRQLDTVLASL